MHHIGLRCAVKISGNSSRYPYFTITFHDLTRNESSLISSKFNPVAGSISQSKPGIEVTRKYNFPNFPSFRREIEMEKKSLQRRLHHKFCTKHNKSEVFLSTWSPLSPLNWCYFAFCPIACHKVFRSHHLVPSRTARCMLTACAAHSRRSVETCVVYILMFINFFLMKKLKSSAAWDTVVPGFGHQMWR